MKTTDQPETPTASDPTTYYISSSLPDEMKFTAVYKGQTIEDDDYWLPDEKAGYWNSYPVKISSRGIHYTRRLAKAGDFIEHSDGRTYYGSWESESVQSKGVSLLLHNVKVHTSATESAASTQVEGCSDQPKSDSERVADCGATPCSISSLLSKEVES